MKKTNVLKIKDMAKQRVLNPTTGKEIYVCGQTFNLLVRNGMCYDKTLNRLTNPVVKSIVSQASEVKAKTDVQCERCGKSFKENTKRNKHYRQKVRCAPLLNDTYTAEELVDRGKYVRQEGQFKCEYCNAGYSTPKLASGHQKICKQNPLHPEYKQIASTAQPIQDIQNVALESIVIDGFTFIKYSKCNVRDAPLCDKEDCLICFCMVIYNKCDGKKRCGKLCTMQDCYICYFSSLDCHARAIDWNILLNPNITPRMIALKSGKYYWFTCDVCWHDIYKRVIEVTKYGQWCEYCAKQKLCQDDDCQMCHDGSFIKSKRSPSWHLTRNEDLRPRDVAIRSGIKRWFTCDECKHDLHLSPDEIHQGSWCCYCSHHQVCADKEGCLRCSENSFASSERAPCWNVDRNFPVTPRDVLKSSSRHFWFKCNTVIKGVICGHEFYASLQNVSAGKWCANCSNGKREREVRTYVEMKMNKKSVKGLKPDWLKNPRTGYNLELDISYLDLNFAIEVQGQQHSQFTSRFQKTQEDFIYQQYKDNYKAEQCIKRGVDLLYVYHDDNYKQVIDTYLSEHPYLLS